MKEYDVIVIGAGPGGYVSAIRAAQLGLKTAIVEKQWLGGVCLNVGCIPSKSLLKNADLAHTLRDRAAEFGIKFEKLELDYGEAVKRSRAVSKRLVSGVGFLMKKNKIDVFMGKALFKTAQQLDVELNDGSKEQIQGKSIIVASGASSANISGMEVDGKKILSYQEAILQDTLPKSVVVIGAGAIGIEFSTIWSSYGTEITIVEMMDRILPLESADASKELARAFKKRKINMLTSTKVKGIETSKTGVKVTIEDDKGVTSEIEAEQALVAIGFRPNTKDLGLEKIGVKMDKRGFIEINDVMATNIPGIFAIGDVTGKLLLAHTASAQGMLAAEHIAGEETTPIDYKMIPRAVYSHPQVASFGYTEEEAKEKGHEVATGMFSFQPNGKALGLGEAGGFVKIFADKKYGEILGASMVGPDVSELLPELTLAQKMELTAEEVARNIHAHPTLSEVVMEAAHGVDGSPIHS
ncbi:MAG: dihydrolipoyl dehydrogenase [Anaerolineaceae bacterium]|nr:dihydrolipoyl dehydrogenase [Anaerolineaceae bacterium]